MDLRQVEHYVKERLGIELPDAFCYHSLRHTQDVVIAAVEFGLAEGVGAEELKWLQAAAWFHDLGYVAGCALGHEERSAEIARDRLTAWGWSDEAVYQVGKLIQATRMPCQPQNHLEEIICDADIEYLGRPDFCTGSARLRAEIAAQGMEFDEAEWLDFELRFLEKLRFFTAAGRRMREAGLAANCAWLKHRRSLINENEKQVKQ